MTPHHKSPGSSQNLAQQILTHPPQLHPPQEVIPPHSHHDTMLHLLYSRGGIGVTIIGGEVEEVIMVIMGGIMQGRSQIKGVKGRILLLSFACCGVGIWRLIYFSGDGF